MKETDWQTGFLLFSTLGAIFFALCRFFCSYIVWTNMWEPTRPLCLWTLGPLGIRMFTCLKKWKLLLNDMFTALSMSSVIMKKTFWCKDKLISGPKKWKHCGRLLFLVTIVTTPMARNLKWNVLTSFQQCFDSERDEMETNCWIYVSIVGIKGFFGKLRL